MPLRDSLAAACLALGAFLATPPSLAAEAPDLLNDRLNLSLGTFAVRTDTTVRVDGSLTDLGTPIDWEETFGEGDANRFRIDAYWRFADRHKLRALVFDSRATRNVTLDQEIEFDGEFFPVNARVDSEFGFTIYELAYEYAFMRRDRYELGASIGVHYTDLEASISGTVRTPAGSASRSASREASVGAPLPVVGLRGTWSLPGHFWLGASAQFFKLSVGDYDGSLQDLRVALHWQPRRWLGLGVGYNRFALDVDATAKDFTGTLDWVYEGPIVFYNVSF